MNNSFYIILPSTGSTEQNAKSNKFRIQLPRKIHLEGHGWQIGLASIIYPNSWATFGSHESEFITLYLKNGDVRHLKIPKGNYHSSKELEKGIHFGTIRELEQEIDFIGKPEDLPRLFKRSLVRDDEDDANEEERAKRSSQARSDGEPPLYPTGIGGTAKGSTGQVPGTGTTITQQASGQPSTGTFPRSEYKLRLLGRDITWLRDRNEWVYAQALQHYLIKYKTEVKRNSPNLQAHITEHSEEFKNLYRLVEERLGTPLNKQTATELMKYAKAIKIQFDETIGRFEVKLEDPNILKIELTNQISYVLGFEEGLQLKNGDMAKYSPDLRGNVSHLCVYLNSGLAEDIMFGNKFTNLLQIIGVEGKNGEVIQKEFQHPLMHKVITREIDSIDVEIRSLDGRFVHFDYGSVILTLLFKKQIYF